MLRVSCGAWPKANGLSSPIEGVPPRVWNRWQTLPLRIGRAILSSASLHAPCAAPKAKPATRTSTGSSMAAADVFMDSAGFLALWDAGDEHHAQAVRVQAELARTRRRFLTSEY